MHFLGEVPLAMQSFTEVFQWLQVLRHGGHGGAHHNETFLSEPTEHHNHGTVVDEFCEPAPVHEARLAAKEIFEGRVHNVLQAPIAPKERELVSYDDL